MTHNYGCDVWLLRVGVFASGCANLAAVLSSLHSKVGKEVTLSKRNPNLNFQFPHFCHLTRSNLIANSLSSIITSRHPPVHFGGSFFSSLDLSSLLLRWWSFTYVQNILSQPTFSAQTLFYGPVVPQPSPPDHPFCLLFLCVYVYHYTIFLIVPFCLLHSISLVAWIICLIRSWTSLHLSLISGFVLNNMKKFCSFCPLASCVPFGKVAFWIRQSDTSRPMEVTAVSTKKLEFMLLKPKTSSVFLKWTINFWAWSFLYQNMELLFTMKTVMLLKHLHILFSVFFVNA